MPFMLPALNDATAALVKASKDADFLAGTNKALNAVFVVGVEEGLRLTLAIARIVAETKALIDASKLVAAGIREVPPSK